MRNDLLNEALEMIRAAGFEPDIAHNRHWKISWIDQRGQRQCLVVASSPSDRRARLGSRSVLRKLLEGAP